MWQTVDYKGNTVKWYEAELIEKIRKECKEALSECCDKGLDADCFDCVFAAMADLAQDILSIIQEYEKEGK